MKLRMTRAAATIVTFITMISILMAMAGLMPTRALAAPPTYEWAPQAFSIFDAGWVNVNGISAVGPNDAWMAVDNYNMMDGVHWGWIYHYDGTTWNEVKNMRCAHLKAMYALDANHVWVAGSVRVYDPVDVEMKDYGRIWFFDGTTWTEQWASDYEWSYDMRSIDALDTNHVYAIEGMGRSRLMFFDGSSWSELTQSDYNLRDIAVCDPNHIYGVGEKGILTVFDGSSWKKIETGTDAPLYGVAAVDPSHVWAVGDNGTIVFYNGKSCVTQESGTQCDLKSVDAVDFRCAVAVGDDGDDSIATSTFDGSAWTSYTRRDENVEILRAVSAYDGRNVFAGGKTWCDMDLEKWHYYDGYVLQGTTDSVFPPAIDTIDRDAGYAGSTVTLRGAGFGAQQGTSEVMFGDVEAVECPLWSDEAVQVKVPAEASGVCDVRVVTADGTTNSLKYTALARIDSIAPGSALPGKQVSIKGSGFGYQGQVCFGSLVADGIASWTPTEIKVNVPWDAYGAMNVTVRTATGATNPARVQVIPNPRSIWPTSARTGQIVTITGSAFGPARGDSQVLFGNVAARQFAHWDNRCIQVCVPTGFTGKVQVKVVTSGGQSAPLSFTKIGR